MSRYVKNVRRISVALGPTEERGAALWVGYDLDAAGDLSSFGLIRVDDLTDEEIAAKYGVTSFHRVDPAVAGIRRKE